MGGKPANKDPSQSESHGESARLKPSQRPPRVRGDTTGWVASGGQLGDGGHVACHCPYCDGLVHVHLRCGYACVSATRTRGDCLVCKCSVRWRDTGKACQCLRPGSVTQPKGKAPVVVPPELGVTRHHAGQVAQLGRELRAGSPERSMSVTSSTTSRSRRSARRARDEILVRGEAGGPEFAFALSADLSSAWSYPIQRSGQGAIAGSMPAGNIPPSSHAITPNLSGECELVARLPDVPAGEVEDRPPDHPVMLAERLKCLRVAGKQLKKGGESPPQPPLKGAPAREQGPTAQAPVAPQPLPGPMTLMALPEEAEPEGEIPAVPVELIELARWEAIRSIVSARARVLPRDTLFPRACWEAALDACRRVEPAGIMSIPQQEEMLHYIAELRGRQEDFVMEGVSPTTIVAGAVGNDFLKRGTVYWPNNAVMRWLGLCLQFDVDQGNVRSQYALAWLLRRPQWLVASRRGLLTLSCCAGGLGLYYAIKANSLTSSDGQLCELTGCGDTLLLLNGTHWLAGTWPRLSGQLGQLLPKCRSLLSCLLSSCQPLIEHPGAGCSGAVRPIVEGATLLVSRATAGGD